MSSSFLTGSITACVADLRDGVEIDAAAARIQQRYSGEIHSIVERRLQGAVRRRVDAEDVAQDTFGSFFVRVQAGQYDLPNRSRLGGLLARMADHKVKAVIRRNLRKRRDVRAECHAGAGAEDSCRDLLQLAPAAEARPDDMVASKEIESILLQSLKSEELVQVAVWRREGCSNTEIASRLGCTERTVERKLVEIRERLGRRLGQLNRS